MTTIKGLRVSKPTSLILTYDNGHTIEFNIESLVNICSTCECGKVEQPLTNTLEITLEYTTMIRYDTDISRVLPEGE